MNSNVRSDHKKKLFIERYYEKVFPDFLLLLSFDGHAYRLHG